MKHKLEFLLVLSLLAFGINVAYAAGDPSMKSPSSSRGSQSAVGTIDKITDDKITVKTEDGKTQSFMIDPGTRDQIKSQAFKEGDRIDLSLNKQNQVVGVNKGNELGGGSNRGSSPSPGGSSPDSGMSPNSGTGTNPNSGTGSSPNSGMGGSSGMDGSMGSGGMSGGPNTGGSR